MKERLIGEKYEKWQTVKLTFKLVNVIKLDYCHLPLCRLL